MFLGDVSIGDGPGMSLDPNKAFVGSHRGELGLGEYPPGGFGGKLADATVGERYCPGLKLDGMSYCR